MSPAAPGWPDLLVAAAATAGVLWTAYRFRGCGSSLDYFLAGRSIPAWAAALSLLSAEVSVLTLLGVPAASYRGDWRYLQFFLGSAAGRAAAAFLFLPAFYARGCATAYEYLLRRFGPRSQRAGAALFLVTRLLASGARLAAGCAVAASLTGLGLGQTAALFVLVSVAAVAPGGARAAAWTGAARAGILLAAAGLSLAFVSRRAGGAEVMFRAARAAGRMSVVSSPAALLAALVPSFASALAFFGADQEMVQRAMSARSQAEGRCSVLLSAAASLAVLLPLLSIGSGLYVFYQLRHPEMALPQTLDGIYTHFAAQIMRAPLRGLVLAAVFMASIDLPLSSLSAAFVNDLYRPLRAGRPDAHYLRAARASAAAFGVVLGAAAYSLGSRDESLWLAFKIGGAACGPLLGVYAYGLATDGTGDGLCAAAMGAGAAASVWLLALCEDGTLPFNWTWIVPIGAAGTFAVCRALGEPGMGDHRA